MHAVRLVISGRVQGVGFRWFVCRHALALPVHGWVRNLADGAVEVEAEGDEAALRSLIADAWRGPTGSHVTGVREHWSQRPPLYRSFEITS
jgi:acylphosphatase